jgi:hypothetical protein
MPTSSNPVLQAIQNSRGRKRVGRRKAEQQESAAEAEALQQAEFRVLAAVEQRIKQLSESYAVRVDHFGFMHSHLHLEPMLLRSVAKTWSELEVSRRWFALHPNSENGTPFPDLQTVIQAHALDTDWVERTRKKLCCLSQWIKDLCQIVAQDYNRAHEETGRFWDHRFHSRELNGTADIYAVAMYIELNAGRAGMVKRPEEAAYTSLEARQHAAGKQPTYRATKACKTLAQMQAALSVRKDRCERVNRWLEPFVEVSALEVYDAVVERYSRNEATDAELAEAGTVYRRDRQIASRAYTLPRWEEAIERAAKIPKPGKAAMSVGEPSLHKRLMALAVEHLGAEMLLEPPPDAGGARTAA